jgi:hypothetical protein
MRTTADTRQAVALGIVFGAATGAIAGLPGGGTVATGAGYGVSTGIVVAALLDALAARLDGGRRSRLALVAGGLLGGALVGGIVGLVAAWAAGAGPLVGVPMWAGAGATVGLLVAGSLVTGRRTPPAPGADEAGRTGDD